MHRTEIDVDLAGESDQFYKSQLLNNNNDITQISFNLLNTQAAATVANTTAATISSTSTTTPTPHHASSSSCAVGQTVNAILTSSSPTLSSISHSNSSQTTINNVQTTTSITEQHNHQQLENEQQQQPQQQELQQQHHQLPTIFVTDHNSNNLALNGFVADSDDLNLAGQDDEANIFIVSTAESTTGSSSPTANDNQQLDQYFMASLMDTEQEIIVS